MRAVRLAEVAEINPPGPQPGELAKDLLVDFVPMAAVSETGEMIRGEPRYVAEVTKGFTAFKNDDVLVAKITPCFENNKIAVADVQSDYAFGSTEFHVVRCFKDAIDPRYLFHFLRQDRVRDMGERRMTGSAGQRRVPKAFLEQLFIPIPLLSEQRRLAGILDHANGLRRKRMDTLNLLDRLRASIFQETFVQNECAEWPLLRVSEIIENARTGPFGSQLLHSEFVDEGIAVLGIDNAVKNEFRWDERRYITPEKFLQLRRYIVEPGDVLITIMGTCGRCAVVPRDIPTAINTKHLCCLTLDRSKALPEFLHAAFLQHPSILKQLGVQTKGAVMPGLNMGIIKSLKLRLPPLDLQRAFAERIRVLNDTQSGFREHYSRLESLFSSLQHRAFAGSLTSRASDRELAKAS